LAKTKYYSKRHVVQDGLHTEPIEFASEADREAVGEAISGTTGTTVRDAKNEFLDSVPLDEFDF